MRELILLRHAESSRGDASLGDFDRPLAPHGHEAAALIGQAMARRGWIPDRVLVSAALRTRQTWQLVAAELGERAPRVEHEQSLYASPAGRILSFVNNVPEETRRLLVVGHNPGIGDLARRLASPDSDAAALARMGSSYPTAALTHFEFEQAWSELEILSARLTDFLSPKALGRHGDS